MRNAMLLFFGLILLTVFSDTIVKAQNDEKIIHNATTEEMKNIFIESSAIPAIQKIITSLETQNAPVPSELKILLDLKDDAETFYVQAERYFGFNWQERLQQEASSLEQEGDVLMMRTRMYLSSLTANAERIAKNSPLDEEEVEAMAINLLRQSRHMEDAEDRRAFFLSLKDTYDQIFIEKNGQSLETFRTEIGVLLTDITDAIGILAKGNMIEKLKAELVELQTHLETVNGTQELTAWLAQFDAFSGKLLSYTLPIEQPLVARDLQILLTNLIRYLNNIPGKSDLSEDILNESQTLLEQRENLSFNEFTKRVKTLLLRISSPTL